MDDKDIQADVKEVETALNNAGALAAAISAMNSNSSVVNLSGLLLDQLNKALDGWVAGYHAVKDELERMDEVVSRTQGELVDARREVSDLQDVIEGWRNGAFQDKHPAELIFRGGAVSKKIQLIKALRCVTGAQACPNFIGLKEAKELVEELDRVGGEAWTSLGKPAIKVSEETLRNLVRMMNEADPYVQVHGRLVKEVW